MTKAHSERSIQTIKPQRIEFCRPSFKGFKFLTLSYLCILNTCLKKSKCDPVRGRDIPVTKPEAERNTKLGDTEQ